MFPLGLLQIGVTNFHSQKQPLHLTVHAFFIKFNMRWKYLLLQNCLVLTFDDRTLWGDRLQLLSYLLVMLT